MDKLLFIISSLIGGKMNKNIIIAILAIVIIAAAAFMFFGHPADGKVNTQINFVSGTSLQNGDQVEFELKDSQGNALAGQNVTISYDESGNVQNYTVVTDSNGKGFLTLNGEAAGNYDITVTYDGDNKYNGCSAKQTITVKEGTSDAQETTGQNATASTVMYNNNTQSAPSASSSVSQAYYDAELNVYYDANGRVIGGQSDGASIYDLRYEMNNPDMIDADGNLQ